MSTTLGYTISSSTLSIHKRAQMVPVFPARFAPRHLTSGSLLVPGSRASLVAKSLSDDEAPQLEWHPEHLAPVMPEDVAATWDFDELRERYTQEMSQQALLKPKKLQLPKQEAAAVDMDALIQWSSKQKFAP